MSQAANHERITRLVPAVLRGGLCLLGLAAVGLAAQAAPLWAPGTGLAPETVSSRGSRAGGLDVTVQAADHAVYLPMVARSYRLLVNGDFEQGLSGWDAMRGPFGAHGSGLPQSVLVFDGGKRGLLGDPNALDNSIPIGHGTIAQAFTLRKPYVRLQYWVFSYDNVKGKERYHDTFEVSVNRAPNQVSDQERDSAGCATSALNPEGMLAVSADGLAFCGGADRSSQGTRWDTGGWKTVTLDLRALQGGNATLYFAVWSREYGAPYYDDRGWFNTWAYVDNVQLVDSS